MQSVDYRNITKDALTPIKKDTLNFRRSSNQLSGGAGTTSKLPASLLLSAVGAPMQGTPNLNKETLASIMQSESFARYFDMQSTVAKIKGNQQVSYAQHLSKQNREGRIRKVNEISEADAEDYPGMSHKKGTLLNITGAKRGKTGPSNQLNKSIDLSSLGHIKSRLTYGSPELHNKSSSLLH